jgi:hypothetical protein
MNPTISIEGQNFILVFPGSREHTVFIPIDQPDKLVAVLMARRNNQLRLGEAGSPVQSMIDRASEVARIDTWCADRRAAALAELGL